MNNEVRPFRKLRWVAGVSLVGSSLACSSAPLGTLRSDTGVDGNVDASAVVDVVGVDGSVDVSTTVEVAGYDATHPDGSGSDADSADQSFDVSDADANAKGSRYRAISVATGEVHACALLDDGSVKCWGINSHGQLGYGDTRDRGSSASEMGDALPTVDLGTGRSATKIVAGHYATCAILDNGSLKCWGMTGLNGQLPGGQIGDKPGEMGDRLAALDFGGRRVMDAAIGAYNACASMMDDTIWCWDLMSAPSRVVALPTRPVKTLSPAGTSVMALFEDGTVSPYLPSGTSPVFAAGNVMAISGATGAPTCSLLATGAISCLPDAFQSHPKGMVAALGEAAVSELFCALFADGTVKCPPDASACSGAYWCEQGGSVALGQAATMITNGGDDFMCALLADGGIKCWTGVPGMDPLPWLGASLTYVRQVDGSLSYEPWDAVDLGKRP